MEELRFGILGCANIAKRSVIPSMLQLEGLKPQAVASRSFQKAKETADEFGLEPIEGYENLISREDIDAVYIPLPTGMHYEWIKKCLQNGKHVLSEKSFTISYQQTLELVELAREKGLLIMEHFMFPFHSQNIYVRKLIADGEIGELRNFRSSFGFPPFNNDENIRYKKELGGGALLDAGAYTVKVAQMILGPKLTVVNSHLNHDQKYGVDLWGSATLYSESHDISAQLAFGFDHFYQCNYEVWGTKGKITVHRAFTAGPHVTPTITINKQDGTQQLELEKDDHFSNLLVQFIKKSAEGKYEKEYEEILIQSFLLDNIRQLNMSANGK